MTRPIPCDLIAMLPILRLKMCLDPKHFPWTDRQKVPGASLEESWISGGSLEPAEAYAWAEGALHRGRPSGRRSFSEVSILFDTSYQWASTEWGI